MEFSICSFQIAIGVNAVVSHQGIAIDAFTRSPALGLSSPGTGRGLTGPGDLVAPPQLDSHEEKSVNAL
jgi:hypothetical protein